MLFVTIGISHQLLCEHHSNYTKNFFLNYFLLIRILYTTGAHISNYYYYLSSTKQRNHDIGIKLETKI